MCGVIAIIGENNVSEEIYNGLILMQHRGQDSAGMMTCDGDEVHLRKNNGLVRDVFHTRHMIQLRGKMGIGHVRYPTAGSGSQQLAQPFYTNSPFGIALGHNGNLTNAESLKKELLEKDLRHINTSSDSEILLNVFAYELRKVVGKLGDDDMSKNVFTAATNTMLRAHGAYSVVIMIVGVGVVAFRDPYGIRPLVYGTKKSNSSHIFASESVVLDVLGYERVGDVLPGEVVFIDLDKNVYRSSCIKSTNYTPCIFEYIYLARPDSVINDIPVYQTRINMGKYLGKRIKQDWLDYKTIDTIISIPDTSRTTALEISKILKIPYSEGFIKNRYIGRTFIMPHDIERKKAIRQKLNAIESEFKDKVILLVDDSIVRGTTSKKIIQLARDAGAKKVYFASASPPILYQNVYGIDLPSQTELIANNRTNKQICDEIGADRLIYQHLDDLIAAVSDCNPKIKKFDTSCFNGKYVTENITSEYLHLLNVNRNNKMKISAENELDFSEISNVV